MTTEQQLEELSQNLSNIDFEQIARKERARADLVQKARAAEREIGQLNLKSRSAVASINDEGSSSDSLLEMLLGEYDVL